MPTAAMTCCAIDVSAIQILVEVKSTGRSRFARFQSSESSCQTSRSFTMDEDDADFLRLSFMLWARVDTSGRFSSLFFLQVRGMMQLLCNPSSSIELFLLPRSLEVTLDWPRDDKAGDEIQIKFRWSYQTSREHRFLLHCAKENKEHPRRLAWPVCAKSEIDNPHDQSDFFSHVSLVRTV